MKKVLSLILILALFMLCTVAIAEESVVSVKGENWDIPATVSMPDGDGPFPCVVMFHGTGSSRDEAGDGYKMLAPKLAEAGIASIRFDFVGNGDSTSDYRNYTLTSGMKDGLLAMQYMIDTGKVDADRIGALGWSQGGTVAILTAARNPEIKSLVTWAGAVHMDGLYGSMQEEAKANGFAVMEFEWRDPLNLSLEWFEEVESIKLTEELANYQGAVCAIAGSLDDVVPLTDLDEIIESSPTEAKEKVLVEGADHTFNVFTGDLSAYEELAAKTVEWFANTL